MSNDKMRIAELEFNIKQLESEKSWHLDKINNIEYQQKRCVELINSIKNKDQEATINQTQINLDISTFVSVAKKLDTNNMLVEDEINIIYNGLDKTQPNRFTEFEKLIDEVIVQKCTHKRMRQDIVLIGVNLCEKIYLKNKRYKLKFSYSNKTDSVIECLTKF